MIAKQGAKFQSKIVKPGSAKSINTETINEIVYDVMKNSCSESIDSGTIYEDMQLISRMWLASGSGDVVLRRTSKRNRRS